MPEWRDCEGQLLDGRYPLERYVGGDEKNALFLIGSASATVRIRRADAAHAAALAARWNRTKLLSHPHILKTNEAGVSVMAGDTVAYLVVEHAEENLAEILCARPLTTDETREMLLQVADALDYLHSRGMTHNDLKASNILAIGDTVKVSSESVVEGDATADIRALGFTLIHALTQRVETFALDMEPAADLPAPFDEIARGCLNPDPALRWTANKIVARLRSPEHTGSSLQATPAMGGKPLTVRLGLRRLAGPAGLVIAGLAVVAGVVMRRTDTPSPAPGDARQPPAAVAAGQARAPAASMSKTVAPVRSDERAQSTSDRVVIENGVTRRIVPNIPEKARSTIEGKPAVVVRISVDQKGNVTKAALERSFSPYFSEFALQAARQWKFIPYDGASSREWILRFEFTRTNTQVVAQRAVGE